MEDYLYQLSLDIEPRNCEKLVKHVSREPLNELVQTWRASLKTPNNILVPRTICAQSSFARM